MDKNTISHFSIKRKNVDPLFDNVKRTKAFLGLSSRSSSGDYTDLSTFYNGSYLDPYFRKIGSNNTDCVKLSNSLYATNRIYQEMLDYLATIYYYRYVVVPRQIKNKQEKAAEFADLSYAKIYNQMVEIVEGMNIETTYPKLLLNIFKNGQLFLYVSGSKKSQTLSTIILPPEKCRPTIMTQYGTTQIEFNFKFFDEVTNSPEKREKLFSIFPQEFRELYNLYKESNDFKDGWVPLNPKCSTCISTNEYGFPTFLTAFYDIIDYKNYKLNEMDRNTNGLERIIAQEVDLQDGLDLAEIRDLHDSMAESISQNGSILITTPGTIKVEQIQEQNSQENKVLSNAYKSIYDNAGFNNALFSNDSDDALKYSLQRDLSFVWQYVEQLTTFYNLAINNIFNFHDYQASIRILPISPYNELEKMELYHQNATLGIGILDDIVATGIKQVDVNSTLELEQFLGLHERLVPLQSSHTQSTTTATVEEEKEEADEQVNEKDSDVQEEPDVDKD